MKNIKIYLMAALFTGCFASCENDRDDIDLSGGVDITSFTINGVEGVIDQTKQTIHLLLPTNADLSGLKPVIAVSDGATVTPSSEETVDFSNSETTPIVYKVVNKNRYNTYKVRVENVKAKITLFRINTCVGDIDEANRTISVFMPEGTDVTALVPTVQYTEGATISPADGTPVDFTNPVVYTLSYVDETFQYTVTVSLQAKPGLVLFNGEDVKPEWGGIAATVESPYANPKTDGINPSPFCASIMKNGADTDDGGKPWSGGALWNNYKVNIDPAEYGSFSLKVLKGVQGDVQLEIQGDGETNKDWLKVWYVEEHLGEWQELVFRIPEGRTAVINNILVAPHCHDAGQPVAFQTQRMYWDDLIAIPK
ncbi:MAG: DUF5018 domain-containing protein [Dysgonamonadaceae bacterium]|jgi:hypothetical protein|nr:DUF5018 domain-containing protein [Dysgonamonadaceae bacterium]